MPETPNPGPPVPATPIGLLIVDDHPIVRDGLRGIFTRDARFAVLGEAAGGAEAVTMCRRHRPDVVLMDLRMPGVDGAAAIAQLTGWPDSPRVVVLTTYDTENDVFPAIEAGATGYLLKDTAPDELVRAVLAAADGEAVLAPSVAARLMNRLRSPAEPMSDREKEVLRLVAQGRTNKEAAAAMFISEATVKAHLLHIYVKLGVNDRAAAVAAGYERGLLGGPRRSTEP